MPHRGQILKVNNGGALRNAKGTQAPLLCVALALLACGSPSLGDEASVAFKQQPGKLVITIGESPLATYVYNDKRILRPYLANLYAPNGVQVTRHHPPVKGKDATDHDTMHPGLWLAFGDISGADFWRNRARVVHERFVGEPKGGEGAGSFTVVNRYVAKDRVICKQTCRYDIRVTPHGTLLIVDTTFASDAADFDFGEQEEMGLGVRVATPLTVRAGGRIASADGRVNEKQVWGRRSDWCDYSGAIDGGRLGVTLMPDPSNFQRCWFHARDYGALVANPIGRRAGGPQRTKVKKGQSLRLRFGVVLHASQGQHKYDPAKAYEHFKRVLAEHDRP